MAACTGLQGRGGGSGLRAGRDPAGTVPELVVLRHLLLPFLALCHFQLELSQLGRQLLLVLSTQALQLLPGGDEGEEGGLSLETNAIKGEKAEGMRVTGREPAGPADAWWVRERGKDRAGVLGRGPREQTPRRRFMGQ